MKGAKSTLVTVAGLCLFTQGLQADDGYPIAGLTPYQRPEAAPVVARVEKNEQWQKKALQGISAPVPKSLIFLKDQGNWYTPFNRPGMTGPYDIREWHRPK